MANPIKTSDLYEDDGTIAKLIEQLQDLNRTYEENIAAVKKEAAERAAANKQAAKLTEDEKKRIKEQAQAADKLEKALKKYSDALGDNEKDIIAVREATKQLNAVNRLEAKLSTAKAGSYNAISAELSLIKIRLKQMTEEEKNSTKEGQELVEKANELTESLKRQDAQIGVHTRNVGNYSSAFGKFGGAIEKVGDTFPAVKDGAEKANAAFNVLRANPIGVLLSAIVLALTAIFNAFGKTQAGADTFNEKLGQISAVADVITGRLGILADAALELFDGNFSAAADKAKSAFSGIKDEINEAIDAATELNNLSIAIETEQIQIVQQASRLKREIKELNKTAEDTSKSVASRESAAKRAVGLSRDLLNAEQSLLDLQRDRIAAEIAATPANMRSREQFLELAEAEAEINDKETEILELQTTLTNKLNTIRDEGARKSIEAEKARQAAIEEAAQFEAESIDRLREKTDTAIELSATASKDKVREIGTAFREGFEVSTEEITSYVDRLQEDLKTATGGEALSILSELLNAEQALADAAKFKQDLADFLNDTPIAVQVTAKIEQLEVEEIETDTFDNLAKKANRELKEKLKAEADKQGKDDLFSLLGLDVSDANKDAIKSAFDFAKEQLFSYAAERTKIAEQNIEAANAEVSAAENALNREIENRNAGFANRVETAERDLALAESQQQKALAQKRKAQRQERRLQTIADAGNLVSASAKIFAQLGFPAALPAIAIMLATFTATKVAAAKAARKNFGKGGMTILNGGTHASGNDTPLGFEVQGRAAYAERGEAVAVIAANKTRKYQSILPDLIDSLNKGTFEREYSAIGEAATDIPFLIPGAATDMSKTERELSAIRRQTAQEKKTYKDGKGRLVEVYKGTTTIYD